MNGTKPRWIVILLFAMLTAVYGCGRPSPSDTVKKFYSALVDRRYDEAIEKYATKNFQKKLETANNKAALFKEWDKTIADSGRIEKIVVTDERINGNRATVKYEIHSAGEVEKMEDNLVWEDGAWRIVFPASD